ncbi:MAG: flagellar hook-length control protein FliK [Acidobacteriota bacterium]|nr:flagellar hook-length control protein FliK [Acidobacteriota bacterium]
MQLAVGEFQSTETATISGKKMRGKKGKKGFSFLSMFNGARTNPAKISGLGQKLQAGKQAGLKGAEPSGLTPALKAKAANALELVDAELPAVKLPKVRTKTGERTESFPGLTSKLKEGKNPAGKGKTATTPEEQLVAGLALTQTGVKKKAGKGEATKTVKAEGDANQAETSSAGKKKAPALKLSAQYTVASGDQPEKGKQVARDGLKTAVIDKQAEVKGKSAVLTEVMQGRELASADKKTKVAVKGATVETPIAGKPVKGEAAESAKTLGAKMFVGTTGDAVKSADAEQAPVAAKIKDLIRQKLDRPEETIRPQQSAGKAKPDAGNPAVVEKQTSRAAEAKVVAQGQKLEQTPVDVKVSRGVEALNPNKATVVAAQSPKQAKATTAAKEKAGLVETVRKSKSGKAGLAAERVKEPRQVEQPAPQVKTEAAKPVNPPSVKAFNVALEQAVGEKPKSASGSNTMPETVSTKIQATQTTQTTQAAQATETPPPRPPQPMFRQVEEGLRQAYVIRPKAVTVKIIPEDLGELRIKVSVEQEQVHAQIEAESRKVAAVLRDHQGELEHRLREKGIDLERLDVREKEEGEPQNRGESREDQAKRREQAGKQGNRQSGDRSDNGGEPGETAEETTAESDAAQIVDGESFSFTV